MEPIFTTSWDDGHPFDLRLGELLAKYGCRGTFYVPCVNRRGRPVLAHHEIRALAQAHEIAGHTLDHCYLDQVDRREAEHQIVEGKRKLEDVLGSNVLGFAYPGGKQNAQVRRAVAEAGFAYARTIEGFRLDAGSDPFKMPTTIQFFPHGPTPLLRNFVRWGTWPARIPALVCSLRARNLQDGLYALIDLACAQGGILHLWGHSWEVEEGAYWGQLEDFLKRVADVIAAKNRVDNNSVRLHRMQAGT